MEEATNFRERASEQTLVLIRRKQTKLKFYSNFQLVQSEF